MSNLAQATTFLTPTPTEVVATRTFSAPRELVFAAHTDPKHVPHWMTGPTGWTMPVCEIDLRPGGTWHFAWRREDGSEMEMTGTYVEVDPPSRLVTSESWGPEWPATENTLELTEVDGGTLLTYTIRWATEAERDAALTTGMRSGMEISYGRLADHLTSLG